MYFNDSIVEIANDDNDDDDPLHCKDGVTAFNRRTRPICQLYFAMEFKMEFSVEKPNQSYFPLF